MKKWIVVLLVLCIALSMAACGAQKNAESDLSYAQEKGTLIVGITDFAPMDYQDESGAWIGFDADLAKAFAESLGVEAQFVEINWDTKENELSAKTIDVVWNGMTLTDGVKKAMETSNAYCSNGQVIVVRSDVAGQYQSIEDCTALSFAVESGSAGEAAVAEAGLNYITVTAQADALMEVSAGTSDACVIDLLMADAMIGDGTSYENLSYTCQLTNEEYGVGFRKGSDLAKALNEFFVKAYGDGTMQELAAVYGVQAALLPQK